MLSITVKQQKTLNVSKFVFDIFNILNYEDISSLIIDDVKFKHLSIENLDLLETVNIFDCNRIGYLSFINLPELKTISLRNVYFQHELFISNLPNLRKLTINDGYFEDCLLLENVSNLKKLSIQKCFFEKMIVFENVSLTEIDFNKCKFGCFSLRNSETVTSLKFVGCNFKYFDLVNLPNLKKIQFVDCLFACDVKFSNFIRLYDIEIKYSVFKYTLNFTNLPSMRNLTLNCDVKSLIVKNMSYLNKFNFNSCSNNSILLENLPIIDEINIYGSDEIIISNCKIQKLDVTECKSLNIIKGNVSNCNYDKCLNKIRLESTNFKNLSFENNYNIERIEFIDNENFVNLNLTYEKEHFIDSIIYENCPKFKLNEYRNVKFDLVNGKLVNSKR